MALPSADALIAQVSDGNLDYAVVPSIDAAASRNIFLDYDVALPVGRQARPAWAVAPRSRRCATSSTRSSRRRARDGTLARLAERYFCRRAAGRAHRRRRVPGAHQTPAAANTGARSSARRSPPASSGGCSRRSPTRSRNGTRSPPARPACAASCRSPRTPRSTWASPTGSIRAAAVLGAARTCATSRPSCRRASPSPTARGSRSPRSTSASRTSRTRASWRRSRSSIRTCGAT